MSKKRIIIITAVLAIILVGSMIGPVMSNVEQPQYQVISSQENIEIREYNSLILAEVEVRGEREETISQGFKILADYIFGNNKTEQDIAMTAPVKQQPAQMITPVWQEESTMPWKISFFMPSEYSMNTLPKPRNESIELKEIPTKKYIVIRFSGTNSNKNIARHQRQLIDYISENKKQVISSPIYAFYNPPWTLPFLRRNEIMIELENSY